MEMDGWVGDEGLPLGWVSHATQYTCTQAFTSLKKKIKYLLPALVHLGEERLQLRDLLVAVPELFGRR